MRSKRLTLLLLVLLLPVSCLFVTGAPAGASAGAEVVTYSKDVAPILNGNCVSCHRPGDIAPMSFTSYKEVRPWARSIREKVITREMPPWHADPQHGSFVNDRRLTNPQIDTIVAWVDQGAREGNPRDLPVAPAFVEGWRIGKPDVLLEMPEEYTLAAEGPDEYKYFRIQTGFKEDVWIQAAEARPGNRRIVHHIIAFIVRPKPKVENSFFKPTPEMMEQLKKRVIFYEDGSLIRVKPETPVSNDGCAMPMGGAGIFMDGTGQEDFGNLLCGQAPGRDPDVWPAGVAKKIPAGAEILLQVHYARTGKVEKDRSTVGLVLAKTEPERQLITWPIQNFYFSIPPGAENHEVSSCYTFKEDARLVSLMPHMHLRGKDMTIRAFYPDGRVETLLSVPRYSFSWQTTYYLKKPLPIPRGTRIQCIAHFDNSTKNKYNPDATKSVRFGDPTYDEMMIGWIDYFADKPMDKKASDVASSSGR
jgi:hypothetical protein